MHIHFHSNLDLVQNDMFELNQHARHCGLIVPQVDSSITIPFMRNGERREYRLRVCSVSFNYAARTISVELNIPAYPCKSIAEWEVWFKRHRLGREY